MPPLPRDTTIDSTYAFLTEGYTFISKRCERYQSDAFETRIMLRNAVCAIGSDAAKMFYHPDRFTRKKAIPPTTLMLLQDKDSVQQLDHAAHRHRKQMFMSLVTVEKIDRLVDIMTRYWHTGLLRWQAMQEIVLHDEVREILCSSVCTWAGIPLSGTEIKQRSREFSAMIDGAGSIGFSNLKGLLLRNRTERWARHIINAIREHELNTPKTSATYAIAWHREADGSLLDIEVAAVELLNLLRPTVAVARFIVFAALALYKYPECRNRLQAGDDHYLEWFVQEVRRFYPFFPLVGGRAQDNFDWQGHRFIKGTWVLLDLYGTNRDPRIWEEPDRFHPERFQQWNGDAFNFIPQGGGDYYRNHRCPGEPVTLALMKSAVTLLTSTMQYDVPKQDLRINLSRMPALPKNGFLIGSIRLKPG